MSVPTNPRSPHPPGAGNESASASVWDALWEPFGEIEPFFRRLVRLADPAQDRPSSAGWSPVAEHEETGDAFFVRIELPGVPQEKVHVEVEGHELCVSGDLDEEQRREGLLARRVGRFAHRTTLPSTADPDRIKAKLAAGVLTVRVPKASAGTRRSVPISGDVSEKSDEERPMAPARADGSEADTQSAPQSQAWESGLE